MTVFESTAVSFAIFSPSTSLGVLWVRTKNSEELTWYNDKGTMHMI